MAEVLMRCLQGRVFARPFLFPITERHFMKKTNAQQLLKRAERQVANTSGGGHLGGTNHGQGYDAKTTSGSNRPASRRPSTAKK
jgi:hypothetical protein